jgi:hypothetical protein
MNSFTMLSFDVEEFDMPLEYGQQISPELQMETGRLGLEALIPVWEKYNTPCTLFTTANYAQHFPEAIKALATKHEIASHTFYHSTFETADLEEIKDCIGRNSGNTCNGTSDAENEKSSYGRCVKSRLRIRFIYQSDNHSGQIQ